MFLSGLTDFCDLKKKIFFPSFAATYQRRGGGQAARRPSSPQICPEQRCFYALSQGTLLTQAWLVLD